MPLRCLSVIHMLLSRSYYEEQFIEFCAPSSQSLGYVEPLCDCCQSSDHDTNSCPDVICMTLDLSKLNKK